METDLRLGRLAATALMVGLERDLVPTLLVARREDRLTQLIQ